MLLVTHGEMETRVVKAPEIGISKGDYIIYKTEAGRDIGRVIDIIPNSHLISYRFATRTTEEDMETMREIKKEEAEKKKECEEILPDYNLNLKLVGCHMQFDRKKIKFYFLAETKIDYRALLKHLSKRWNKRMEFQQIGARDYAKTFTDYGVCGFKTCCSCFITNFESITTTLLRLQNLACGTDKATGICGKLMCCLKYEEEFYKEQEEKIPPLGSLVSVEGEEASLIERNVITEKVVVRYKDGRKKEISVNEIERVSKLPVVVRDENNEL